MEVKEKDKNARISEDNTGPARIFDGEFGLSILSSNTTYRPNVRQKLGAKTNGSAHRLLGRGDLHEGS